MNLKKKMELRKALTDHQITQQEYDSQVEELNNAKISENEIQKQKVINLHAEGTISDTISEKCIKILNKR